jgi:hypothetical protein
MTSHYSSDPRVPPARVDHLGRHDRRLRDAPVTLPTPERPPHETPPSETPPPPAVDADPTYADFLEPDAGDRELPGQTG